MPPVIQFTAAFLFGMMEDKKRVINWEKIELDYRAGVKTLREIASDHDITHAYIKKKANQEGWIRDLTAKIKAKADALVTKSAVTAELPIKESEIVDANAVTNATIQIKQRKDITRMREVVAKLVEELDQQESFMARVDCSKKISDSLKTLIDLERRVYKIDDDGSGDTFEDWLKRQRVDG